MNSGPRHERVSLRSPRSSSGSGPERATKDIALPPAHPIGLADQRKPLVKFSLIIVNAAVALIRAGGNTSDGQNSAPKTLIYSAPLRPGWGRQRVPPQACVHY